MDDLMQLDLIEELELDGARPIRDRFRQRVDSFTLPDNQFVKIYRLTKDLTRQLIAELGEFMPAATRASALDVKTRVLIALRFYASGSYQTGVGNDTHLAVSQKSVSKAILEVSEVLNHIMDRWINFPTTPQEQASIMRGFSDKYGVGGIVGLIDCTHVAIVSTPVNDPNYAEHIYVNRKGAHTINVQLVCDANLKIQHINAQNPGSASDKFIWRHCNLREYFVEEYTHNRNHKKYLLGDSGYALEPWLLIPVNAVADDSPEQRYNDLHCAIRSGIERCNGLLKQRYRCLLKDRVLHYHPEMASLIINACCVLHNMCIAHEVPEPDSDESDDEENEVVAVDHEVEVLDGPRVRRNPVLIAGERQRAEFIQRYLV